MNEAVAMHVGLTVSDLGRSIDFYVGCLGFKVAEPQRNVSGATLDRVQGLQNAQIEVAYLRNGIVEPTEGGGFRAPPA